MPVTFEERICTGRCLIAADTDQWVNQMIDGVAYIPSNTYICFSDLHSKEPNGHQVLCCCMGLGRWRHLLSQARIPYRQSK